MHAIAALSSPSECFLTISKNLGLWCIISFISCINSNSVYSICLRDAAILVLQFRSGCTFQVHLLFIPYWNHRNFKIGRDLRRLLIHLPAENRGIYDIELGCSVLGSLRSWKLSKMETSSCLWTNSSSS